MVWGTPMRAMVDIGVLEFPLVVEAGLHGMALVLGGGAGISRRFSAGGRTDRCVSRVWDGRRMRAAAAVSERNGDHGGSPSRLGAAGAEGHRSGKKEGRCLCEVGRSLSSGHGSIPCVTGLSLFWGRLSENESAGYVVGTRLALFRWRAYPGDSRFPEEG